MANLDMIASLYMSVQKLVDSAISKLDIHAMSDCAQNKFLNALMLLHHALLVPIQTSMTNTISDSHQLRD